MACIRASWPESAFTAWVKTKEEVVRAKSEPWIIKSPKRAVSFLTNVISNGLSERL